MVPVPAAFQHQQVRIPQNIHPEAGIKNGPDRTSCTDRVLTQLNIKNAMKPRNITNTMIAKVNHCLEILVVSLVSFL